MYILNSFSLSWGIPSSRPKSFHVHVGDEAESSFSAIVSKISEVEFVITSDTLHLFANLSENKQNQVHTVSLIGFKCLAALQSVPGELKFCCKELALTNAGSLFPLPFLKFGWILVGQNEKGQ